MTLTIPAQFEGFVRDKVKSGSYSNESEVLGAALGMMQKHNAEEERQLQKLRESISRGVAQAKAGQSSPAEEVWARLEEQKRQWQTARSA